jgi:peptidoglycan/LPS O-acetylase OafA/YrhL
VQNEASTDVFPRRQLPALTGIRALAAFWVFARHFRTELLGAFPGLHILAPLMNTGYLGVDLFFILSGFILTYTHFDKLGTDWNWRKAIGFLWLRIGRVWPLTAFVLVLFGLYFVFQTATASTTAAAANFAKQANVGELLQHLLLIQAWIPAPLDWNGLDWSISAEWLAYLVFSVGIIVLARFALSASKSAMVILIAILTLPMIIIGCTQQDDNILLFFPNTFTINPGIVILRVVTEFWIGAILAILLKRRLADDRPLLFPLATVASVIAIAVIYLVTYLDKTPWIRAGSHQFSNGVDMVARSSTIIVLPLFVLVIAGLAIGRRDPLAWVLSTRVFQVGGRASFALYLSHALVIGLAVAVLAHVSNVPIRDAITLAVIVAVWVFAWILWRFIEEPSRKLARRMLPRSVDV